MRTLILSSLIMVLINPWILLSISFQLSVAATFGLIWTGYITALLGVRREWQVALFPVTTWMLTIPITSQFGNTISLWFGPVNLIATVLTPIYTLIHILSAVPILGHGFGYISHTLYLWADAGMNIAINSAPLLAVSEFGRNQTIGYYAAIGLVGMTGYHIQWFQVIESRTHSIAVESHQQEQSQSQLHW